MEVTRVNWLKKYLDNGKRLQITKQLVDILSKRSEWRKGIGNIKNGGKRRKQRKRIIDRLYISSGIQYTKSEYDEITIINLFSMAYTLNLLYEKCNLGSHYNLLFIALLSDMDNPDFLIMLSILVKSHLDDLYSNIQDSGTMEWLAADDTKGSPDEGKQPFPTTGSGDYNDIWMFKFAAIPTPGSYNEKLINYSGTPAVAGELAGPKRKSFFTVYFENMGVATKPLVELLKKRSTWRSTINTEETQAGGVRRRRRKGSCRNTKKKSSCNRRKNCNWSKGYKRRGSRKRVSGSCKKGSRSRRRR